MNNVDKILARIEPDPNSGCWLWSAYVNREGYGEFMGAGRQRFAAHRMAYELWCGEIPSGLVIDHKCRTRSCCNPAHLRAVTWRVNTIENSTSFAAINAAKTHCVHGHALVPENLTTGTRWRRCRTCLNARKRRVHRERGRTRPRTPRKTNSKETSGTKS